jgi:hypothetical protein
MTNDNPILNNPPELHYATDPKDGSLNYNDKKKGRRIFSREQQVITMKQIQATVFEMNDVATKEDHIAVRVISQFGEESTKVIIL